MNRPLSSTVAPQAAAAGGRAGLGARARLVLGIFKLRIGVLIMVTALAGMAVVPGGSVTLIQALALALSVLLSSAAAGAFNQFWEVDLDARMGRTRNRPFVTGAMRPHAGCADRRRTRIQADGRARGASAGS